MFDVKIITILNCYCVLHSIKNIIPNNIINIKHTNVYYIKDKYFGLLWTK